MELYETTLSKGYGYLNKHWAQEDMNTINRLQLPRYQNNNRHTFFKPTEKGFLCQMEDNRKSAGVGGLQGTPPHP